MLAYDSSSFSPPAPVALVTLRDSQSGATQADVPMLLDTGADVTLLPQAAVNSLGVATHDVPQYELVGFDGSRSFAPTVRLELSFMGRTFRGQFLLVEQDWGIIGRNILNALPLMFDGPNLTWDFVSR